MWTTNLPERTAIATTTFYSNGSEHGSIRAEIAKRSLKMAADLGYHVISVDSGSDLEFKEELWEAGIRIGPQIQPGMGGGRRQAIQQAYDTGRDFIVWTEPEKEGYITQIEQTVDFLARGNAEMVIPARASLDSYPLSQQHAERFGNAFWKQLTGFDFDIWFGPRVFRRDLSSYFLDYDGKYGDKWDSIFVPVLDAVLDGRKVIGIEIDYIHPKEQTEFEKNDLFFYRRRLEQLTNLVNALENRWTEHKR